LEAAHITPYLGPQTNDVSNGLLLRADIHTLFDLGLLSVDSTNYRILVSKVLDGTEYQSLAGKDLLLPGAISKRPSTKALKEHQKIFQPQ
jgi:predicted restriction endonuclease